MSVSQGSWELDAHLKQPAIEEYEVSNQSSFLEENKGTIILISGVAFVIIGSLVSAGVLIHLDINTIAQWSLLGVSGGTFLVSMAVGGVLLIQNCQKKEEQPEDLQPITYSVLTWNVATLNDYGGMRKERRKRSGSQDLDQYEQLQQQLNDFSAEKNKTFDSYILQLKALKGNNELEEADRQKKIQELKDNRTQILNQEKEREKLLSDRSVAILQEERTNLFKTAFTQFGSLDFGCFQESDDMTEEQLTAILGKDYNFYSFKFEVGNKDKKISKHRSTVFWNSAKFDWLNTAQMDSNASKDAIVLLKDKANGTTACVGSGYLQGFNLASTNETKSAGALPGDKQTSYDLKTMDRVQANLYIFAGDFNVTEEHYPERLNIIREHGYVTDVNDKTPTFEDANLRENERRKPVKLDYFYAKAGENMQIGNIQSARVEGHDLDDYVNRPSDHLPVQGTITITRPLTV